MKAIIIDSSRGVRRLDPNQSYPWSLKDVWNVSAMQWTRNALRQHEINDIVVVAGYHMEKLVERFPEFHFRYHAAWQTEGPAYALRLVLGEIHEPCIIWCGNTVFREEALARMLQQDAPLCAGLTVKHTQEPPNKEREFSSIPVLFMVHPETLGIFRDNVEAITQTDKTASFANIYQRLRESSCGLTEVDLDSMIVSLSEPVDLARFVLGNKAQTLERLKPLVTKSHILDQVSFTATDWKAGQPDVLQRIVDTLGKALVIVRSSSAMEDAWHASEAGRFDSVQNVNTSDTATLGAAIEKVLASYGRKPSLDDHVLVQPQLCTSALAGVVLTRDLNTNAPYYVINYEESENTDGVTSGKSTSISKLVCYRDNQAPLRGKWSANLVDAVREVEELTGCDSLDIEFAIDHENRVFIFQVRPLVISRKSSVVSDEDIAQELENIESFLSDFSRERPSVFGRGVFLGNMPDWNPAEMIGTCPRPLAMSLYQTLITDRVWAEARAASGYRAMFPEPLMISLAGKPYIDIRVSLNSFLPADLPDDIARKLIQCQLDVLKEHPVFHDKIEFFVATTCASFDLPDRLDTLVSAGLEKRHIGCLTDLLVKQTDAMISGALAPLAVQSRALRHLDRWHDAALCPDTKGISWLLTSLHRLHADTCRFGTFPFSILARYAFIGVSFLRSMKNLGVFTEMEYDDLLASIPTVASELANELDGLGPDKEALSGFLARYGHLRPGTYDILSPTLKQAPERYLDMSTGTSRQQGHGDARAMLMQRENDISGLLKKTGLSIDSSRLIDFILESIAARETAKFEFTRNVSLILELISLIGERMGFSRDDMSFVPIDLLLKSGTASVSGAWSATLRREINHRKKYFQLSKHILLPPLILDAIDIYRFSPFASKPNFITGKTVEENIIVFRPGMNCTEIDGAIVAIEQADPGYDWVFARPIAGLVTEFGGAASHMAIRAAEFGIPAAIGCGETLFTQIREASRILLDCQNERIVIL